MGWERASSLELRFAFCVFSGLLSLSHKTNASTFYSPMERCIAFFVLCRRDVFG